MTDSVTLYRQHHRGWYEDTWKEYEKVGEFVSRPWCNTHDLPAINSDGTCAAEFDQEFALMCEQVEIWVEVPDE